MCFSDSMNTADSFNRYPIDVAARHGLAWVKGMKELLERSNSDILERQDVSTGLYPFMIVAAKEKHKYNLVSVYQCIILSREVHKIVVRQTEIDYEEKQCSKKRKMSESQY